MGKDINLSYYQSDAPGRDDYWKKMAAPRFRVSTILKIISEIKPTSVVDLGCGNGQLLKELKKKHPACHMTGIDLSKNLIESNKQKDPDVDWFVANLNEETPFEPNLKNKFDVVLASEIIEHVDNPLIFLKNAAALAKPPSGKLILSTQSGPVRETEKRVGHKQHFSAEKMKHLLSEGGWRPVQIWNAGYPFHDVSKWIANRHPDQMMKKYSEQAYTPLQNVICFALRIAFKLNSNKKGAQLFVVASKP